MGDVIPTLLCCKVLFGITHRMGCWGGSSQVEISRREVAVLGSRRGCKEVVPGFSDGQDQAGSAVLGEGRESTGGSWTYGFELLWLEVLIWRTWEEEQESKGFGLNLGVCKLEVPRGPCGSKSQWERVEPGWH